ncbi:histone deacetylase 8 [Paragonimus westermani]|uniref:histone deacetylase n=1 Tax=Paragonimus westermani TaxID=34504 RepID=A0A5J4NZP1_9TREM|nr:histone deacetylase 8 [Paragonimus westermani]
MCSKRVGVVFSDNYRQSVCSSPKFLDRFAMVMDLINAYGIVRHLVRIPPLPMVSLDTIRKELTVFHSRASVFVAHFLWLFRICFISYCIPLRTDYIEALCSLQDCYSDESEPAERTKESVFDAFGLSYDCPGFPRVWDYALSTVQGSLAAADVLLRGACQVAINWAGGWHHAKRSEAAGFCYLNDIVLAIHRLQTRLLDRCVSSDSSDAAQPSDHVLYIDLDLHHGDGVEEAFWYSPRVVTFSVHHAASGFFPGTGTWVQDEQDPNSWTFPSGAGRGRYAAFNFPLGTLCCHRNPSVKLYCMKFHSSQNVFGTLLNCLRSSDILVVVLWSWNIFTWQRRFCLCHYFLAFLFSGLQAEGADDLTWTRAVLPVLNMLHALVRPAYVVIQCGGDCLSNDPHRIFNLTNMDPDYIRTLSVSDLEVEENVITTGSYVNALKLVLSWNVPTLILGGGGYDFASTARLWARLTAIAVEHVTGSE